MIGFDAGIGDHFGGHASTYFAMLVPRDAIRFARASKPL
jgi:hypothetical protein